MQRGISLRDRFGNQAQTEPGRGREEDLHKEKEKDFLGVNQEMHTHLVCVQRIVWRIRLLKC